jgi:hypothetical protein
MESETATYELIDGVWKDVWRKRDMTAEEKTAKQQGVITLFNTRMDDLIRVTDIIFSGDEMAMLGGIIGFWFGSRSWSKK